MQMNKWTVVLALFSWNENISENSTDKCQWWSISHDNSDDNWHVVAKENRFTCCDWDIDSGYWWSKLVRYDKVWWELNHIHISDY
jgi:hypothetical protein